MYIPEEAIDLAMNKGYTVTLSPKKGASAKKGNRNIWSIYGGWQSADIIDGRFKNHMKFDNFIDALNRDTNF